LLKHTALFRTGLPAILVWQEHAIRNGTWQIDFRKKQKKEPLVLAQPPLIVLLHHGLASTEQPRTF
jgi:hypothetical protein